MIDCDTSTSSDMDGRDVHWADLTDAWQRLLLLRVRWRQVRLESLTWLDLIFLHYNVSSCQVTSGQTWVSYLTWSYLLTLQCVFVSGDVRSDSSLLLDLILSSYITTCLRVRWRQVRLESLTWLDLIFLHYNLCWMLAQSTVGLEKEAQYQHNCFSATLLSTFIMVCTVQWYEQFLQVVRLYQALILLGLALYLPTDSVSSIFMVLYI